MTRLTLFGYFRSCLNNRSESPKEECLPDTEILDDAKKRRITRLVHFTRIESLKNIVKDQTIRSRKQCSTCIVNDPKRLDQHLDYICCSVEYPNVFVMDRYSQRFPGQDWIILFLDIVLLGLPTTKFSPVNAATANGAHIQSGIKGFHALFKERVGSWDRLKSHLEECPTNLQAEILVKGAISTRYITAVVVQRKAVEREVCRIPWSNRPSVYSDPDLFNAGKVKRIIRGC